MCLFTRKVLVQRPSFKASYKVISVFGGQMDFQASVKLEVYIFIEFSAKFENFITKVLEF
jgi:hypothetical protein